MHRSQYTDNCVLYPCNNSTEIIYGNNLVKSLGVIFKVETNYKWLHLYFHLLPLYFHAFTLTAKSQSEFSLFLSLWKTQMDVIQHAQLTKRLLAGLTSVDNAGHTAKKLSWMMLNNGPADCQFGVSRLEAFGLLDFWASAAMCNYWLYSL